MFAPLRTRLAHVGVIGRTWWLLLATAWGVFWALDESIEKWNLFGMKEWWDAHTTHLPTHWEGWLIGLLVLAVVGLIDGSFRHFEAAANAATGTIAEGQRKVREADQRLYDGRPLFVLEVGAQKAGGIKEWYFSLRNVGGRPARYIRLEAQFSGQGRYNLHFVEVLALPSNESAPMSYWVTDRATPELIPVRDDQSMLRKFVSDNVVSEDPFNNVALTWWDIKIQFRDTDESVKEEIARLCFDVETDVLYATAVPYTERGRSGRGIGNVLP
jgi:hypothetical protein